MSNNELLQKVVATSEAAAESKGGALEPAQARAFIDYMQNETVLAQQVRVERIRENSAELKRVGIGTRLLRVATEAVDDGVNFGAAFSKINISTTKYRLDWELSTESLEDGIEGANLEDHIARMVAAQVGNDLEDLAINGDSAKTTDPMLKGFDGWSKRANAVANIVDAGGANFDRSVTHRALKAMPRKYMSDRGNLKFFVGSNLSADYQWSEQLLGAAFSADAGINSAQVPTGPLGFTQQRAWGQTIQEVPKFEENKVGTYSGGAHAENIHGEVWLTNPQNLVWAVKREVQVFREFKPKKDAIEYTVFCRVGTAIENGDAMVVVKNVAVKD